MGRLAADPGSHPGDLIPRPHSDAARNLTVTLPEEVCIIFGYFLPAQGIFESETIARKALGSQRN